MRTRNRQTSVTTRYYSRGVNYPSGSDLWNDDTSGTYTYTLSSMIDEPHGLGRINDVSHIRRKIGSSTMSLPMSFYKNGTFKAEVVCVSIFYAGPNGSLDVDKTTLLQSLVSDANGSMPQQMALVVNAVELATLKDLIPGLLQGFTGFRKHRFSRKSLKDLAGSHLAYSFGLAPLVSDFRALLGIRQAIKKRIAELEKRNGKPRRITKRVSNSGSFTDTQCRWPGSLDHKVKITSKWSGTVIGTLSADVASFFVNNAESQCKLWSSALGLSSPLTNIWELVPFSFVIDWFIPIGNAFLALEQKLGLHETVQSLDIKNFCYSEKTELSCATDCTVESPNYSGWDGKEFRGSTVTQKSYVRSPGCPATDFISDPSGWSMNRTALSISLIAQKAIK